MLHFLKTANGLLLLVSLFLFSLFSGCATTSDFQYVDPRYRNLSQTNVSVLFIPFVSNLLNPIQRDSLISKKTKEFKPITTTEINFFENYMPIVLADHTINKIIIIEQPVKPSDIEFVYKKLITDDGKEQGYYIPAKEQFVYEGDIPDYLFLAEDIYFRKSVSDKEIKVGRGSSSYFSLDAGIDYLLWDNKKGKVSAFGNLTKQMTLLGLPERTEYLSVFDDFAKSIISKSPLALKNIKF